MRYLEKNQASLHAVPEFKVFKGPVLPFPMKHSVNNHLTFLILPKGAAYIKLDIERIKGKLWETITANLNSWSRM